MSWARCLRFSVKRTNIVEALYPKEAWNLIEMLKAVGERGQPDATAGHSGSGQLGGH